MSFLLASSAFGFLGLVGYDLLSTTVRRTSQSIVGTVYYLSDTPKYYGEIYKTIYKLDLEAKMAIIQSFLKQLKNIPQENKLLKEKLPEINDDSDAEEGDLEVNPDQCFEQINMIDAILVGYTRDLSKTNNTDQMSPEATTLVYINQSLVRIDELLNIIKKKISNHEQRWFKKWRVLNCSKYLNSLEMENKILMDRLELIKSCHWGK